MSHLLVGKDCLLCQFQNTCLNIVKPEAGGRKGEFEEGLSKRVFGFERTQNSLD